MVSKLICLLNLGLTLLEVANLGHTVGITTIKDAERSRGNTVAMLRLVGSVGRRAVRALVGSILLATQHLGLLLVNEWYSVVHVLLFGLLGALNNV